MRMTPVDPAASTNVRPKRNIDRGTARNLPDAANSDNSLEGYAAVSGLADHSEIARRAHELYLQRVSTGAPGSPDDDWFRAEQEVRRNRMQRNMG
ncbi:MAG TPA: DUF2934 domain-containing protein [Bryobacteraceae bacterium]|nr:DUF2934 domain-containing protein [Bryobacteraceae bacterium]